MSNKLRITAFIVLLAIVAGGVLIRRSVTPDASPAHEPRDAHSAPSTQPPIPPAITTPAVRLPQESIALLNGEEGLRQLEDIAAAADHIQTRFVGRYLAHPEAELRAAAREALVQIGGQESIDLLKEAAAHARDPDEAAELRKAAAFVALPSWTETRQKRALQTAPAKP